MARQMKAAQYDVKNRKILVHKIPVPEPVEDQLLVKITAASLCHSDLMVSQRPPNFDGAITIGHEGVGVVADMHPSAKDKGFKIGDKIGMLYVIDCCFKCEGCETHATFCIKPKNGYAKIQGLQSDGYFAEYAVVDWHNAIHLPDGLPMEKMSPIFCAGLTAFHSVDKCELQSGQWLAIVGCGGVGQLAMRYAKAMGLKIIALDINDAVLERAKQLGADATFNPKTDPKFFKEIRKLTGTRGAHAAAVYSDSNAAYDTAQRALTFQGVLMVVGLPEKPVQMPAFGVSLGLFRVKGASFGTVAELKKAVDFTLKHKIIPEVEFRKLEDMEQMWDEMSKGKAEKRQAVYFGDSSSESKL